jgi:hypothetical protein
MIDVKSGFAWLALCLGSVLAGGQSAHARGGDVGNGGDAIRCAPSTQSRYSGLYALDYLLTVDGDSKRIVDVRDWRESLKSIGKVLAERLPELSPGFEDFRSHIRSSDFTGSQVWEKSGESIDLGGGRGARFSDEAARELPRW